MENGGIKALFWEQEECSKNLDFWQTRKLSFSDKMRDLFWSNMKVKPKKAKFSKEPKK